MAFKYKDFFKEEIKEEKVPLNEDGFFSDLISNIFMLLIRGNAETAYNKMRNDPKLIRLAKDVEDSKKRLEQTLQNSPGWKAWVLKNKDKIE